MEQQDGWSPRAEAIMRMAKILAWLRIDPDVEVDVVWSSLHKTTQKNFVRQARLVLEKMAQEGGS